MPTNKYDKIQALNQEKYILAVRKAYLKAIKEISAVSYKLKLNPNDEFYFRNHPSVNKAVNDIIKELYSNVYGTTVSGIQTDWGLAVEKNNAIAIDVFGKTLDELPTQYKKKYLSNNASAQRAFISRKENGLGLSQRVWRNTKQFKAEVELGLEATLSSGIGTGQSADKLSKRVRQYLNEPDKLFRRIRDKETGALRLSKAAKSYNPGRGVYRSSYKNAQRLTRNETNFSYERSQFEKRKEQDFIVGIEIFVSPGHSEADDKGGICCTCLQGRYPKNFDFTNKWHVNCKCSTRNILKTKEELDKDIDSILGGGTPSKSSINTIGNKPKAYSGYLKDNADKWKNWKNQPRTFEVNN